LKNNTFKYAFSVIIVILLVACSTKRNTFLARKSHSLSTKYNILYNGGIALDQGVVDLKSGYKDNFWEILPIERMQVSENAMLPGQTRNANFEKAETKAAKAIQKHSMNIDGSEKNPQMDEAHLMLGKSRYYDQRFIPALEAFNYILYKYPTSDKINEIKIWREKTNMRLDNDGIAVTNLRKLLKEIKFKDQIFADANATLAQAFLNLEEKDSAIAKLKLATEFTNKNEEKARYRFILGQLYEQKGYKDSAFASFQDVIDMNRKSSRLYVIQAHAKQAQQFDYKNGDTLAFVEKFNDLLKDRENRPFLDILNHQMGLFYDKNKKAEIAKKYYNKSLKNKTNDTYLVASNYRNIAEINFNLAKYVTAGKYYDSTLAALDVRSREFKAITKKRENLEDVIKFEGIAQRNDSILKLSKMSDSERETYFTEYISKLKKEEELQKIALEKAGKDVASNGNDENVFENGKKNIINNNIQAENTKAANQRPNFGATIVSNFYFYNPTTLAYGKTEFVKKWGKREYGPNWRLSSSQISNSQDDEITKNDKDTNDKDLAKAEDEKYTTNFYIKQLPTATKDLDSIAKQRNFAYYQLGVIYKEKFKEYQKAADKLELLLQKNPEERLVLPSLYNLYKIYEIIDPNQAIVIKNRIIKDYPDSRYAQLLNNNSISLELGSPEVVYKNLYNDYEKGLYRETVIKTDMAIVEFTGEEILSKFELLKANLIGKLYGLPEYKKALNFVALTYPNSEEGKSAETFITKNIPYLEALYFNDEEPTSWKIIYQPKSIVEKDNKPLLDKLNKFIKERSIGKLTLSTDVYTFDKNLIVIHGIKSETDAKGIAQVLKEFKDYKIQDVATVISSENYRVVQVFKNLEEYIIGKGPNFEPKQKPVLELPKEEKALVQQQKKITIPDSPDQPNKADIKQNNQQQQMNTPGKSNQLNGNPKAQPNNGTFENMMPPSPNMPQKR
jgi:tetratricopeptide (TPR) repeat protein